jgi:transposase
MLSFMVLYGVAVVLANALVALTGTRLKIDAQFPARLASATDFAGQPLAAPLQRRILDAWELLQVVEALIKTRRREERARVRVPATALTRAQRLAQLRRIAARTATILADELFCRELGNRRQVGALRGLVSARIRVARCATIRASPAAAWRHSGGWRWRSPGCGWNISRPVRWRSGIARHGSASARRLGIVAATLKRHLDGVLRFAKRPITNAVAEDLNSKIMSIKRKAAGFQNPSNFTTAIYSDGGGLDLHPR